MLTLGLKLGLTALFVALVVLGIERAVFTLGEIGRKVFQISLGAVIVFLALQIILWLWIFL